MKAETGKIIGIIVILAALVSVAGCSADEEEVEMTVDHFKQPCVGVDKQLCMRVDKGEGFGNFYDNIAGFQYEWGYVQEIVVLKREAEAAMDGSSVEYELLEVVSKTPSALDATFELPVEPGSEQELVLDLQDGGHLMDQTPFACDSTQICEDLEAALDSETAFTVEFGYNATDESMSLVARGVLSTH